MKFQFVIETKNNDFNEQLIKHEWMCKGVMSIYLLHEWFNYAGIESSNVAYPHNGTYDLCPENCFEKTAKIQRSYVPLCGCTTFELSIPAYVNLSCSK